LAAAEAAKSAAEILRGMAGTAEVFVNHGKLIRMAAAAAAEQTAETGPGNADEQTLMSFLTNVYLPSRIEVSKNYAAFLCTLVARLNAFIGHPVRVDELSEGDLCRFLMALRQSSSPRSVNNYRTALVTLWKAAYDQGVARLPPRLGLIRRLPVEYDPPEAWPGEECNRLFSAAAEWPGMVGEIPAGQWWLSLLLSIYWTACRIGALLGTPTAGYKDGRLLVRRQKNLRSQLYSLPASCCAAIDATNPVDRELLWPWPHCRRHLFTEMRRIVAKAGIAQPGGGRQLFHRLRRTSLSLCAAIDPAIAMRQAGHSDYATTLRHYIDPRMASGRCAADVLPEPIIRRANGQSPAARARGALPQPAAIGPNRIKWRGREVIEFIK
jgi:integrase